MSYNPKPPRAWSRVQNRCTFLDDTTYGTVFVPLTGKTITQFEADYQQQMLYKGNILQYKNNGSNLTKSQKYSKICTGTWTNRTKSYATQTQTYTNPNTRNLKQVNFVAVPSNGNTTYIPGPYNFNIPAPYGCTSNIIKDGGNLLCNTIVNPCTDEIIKETNNDGTVCYPTYCSDVPGQIQDLCWNSKLETFYPKQRYVMPTSGNKWPEGYKGFVSAVDPETCISKIISNNNNINATINIINDTNNNNNNNNNSSQNLVNSYYYVIENTDNEDNSIELSNYLKNNNNIITIDNRTNKNLIINSTYLISDNLCYPNGTNIVQLYPNYTITIFYNSNNKTSTDLIKARIF